MLYAHTPNSEGKSHELFDHLFAVATLASKFAKSFGGSEIAWLVGLWHDIGKLQEAFQDYLASCHCAFLRGDKAPKSSVPHSIWGAAFAYSVLTHKFETGLWHYVALPIQAHHGRLPDKNTRGVLSILEFLETHPDALEQMVEVNTSLLAQADRSIGKFILSEKSAHEQDLYVRMQLSVLTDADQIDTEAHFESSRSDLRRRNRPSIEYLDDALTKHISRMEITDTRLNRIQRSVWKSCVKAGENCVPGMYRLTVPTGAGKTLSSMAFALAHAREQCFDNVIVALPYTSVIEQNARVYREIQGFGDDAVLEHHSAVDLGSDGKERQDLHNLRAAMASENWDSPIVVTTTVQLFESLFSNKKSRIRKLHRLAKSVIILDEAQSLPPELLIPTLDVLKSLAKPVESGGYGATVVLCTATQPSFNSPLLASIFEETRIEEINADFERHFKTLRRVDYQWKPQPVAWNDLASELQQTSQFMVVLNTKKDALGLFETLDDGNPSLFHLSAHLCMAHRRDVLRRLNMLLDEGGTTRLISTQVVECGVDIDFPVVYRAVGPLDRLVQAAGRCNRKGQLKRGRVVIFNPRDGAAPNGPYEIGIRESEFLLGEIEDANRLHDPSLHEIYFERLYSKIGGDLDKYSIQNFREALNFPEVARLYRFHANDTVPIVVQYGHDWHIAMTEFAAQPNRISWQRLQPFVVNLYERDIRRQAGNIQVVAEGLYLWTGDYDDRKGLIPGATDEWIPDPSDLIV